jgi:hypothetical protein
MPENNDENYYSSRPGSVSALPGLSDKITTCAIFVYCITKGMKGGDAK